MNGAIVTLASCSTHSKLETQVDFVLSTIGTQTLCLTLNDDDNSPRNCTLLMKIHYGIVIHDTDNSPRNCNSQRRHCYSFWPISLLSFTHVNALSQRNHLYPFISSKVNDKSLSLSIVEALNCRASALSRSIELN